MNRKQIIVVLLVCIIIYVAWQANTVDPADHEAATRLATHLETFISSGQPIQEISDDELMRHQSRVLLAKVNDTTEAFSLPQDYWREHYYRRLAFDPILSLSYPPTSFPPFLYSDLYRWSPGFLTNGWSWYLRPSVSMYAGSGNWFANNGRYYYIY